MQQIILDVKLHSDGTWVITSEQVPGLILGGEKLLQLLKDLPLSLKMLNDLNNIGLDVSQPIQAVIKFEFFAELADTLLHNRNEWSAAE